MRSITHVSMTHRLAIFSVILVATVVIPGTGAQEEPSMSLEFTNDYVGWHAFLIEPSADLEMTLLYWYGYSPNAIFFSFFDEDGAFLAGSELNSYSSLDGFRVRYEGSGVEESFFLPKRLTNLATGFPISMENEFQNGVPARVTLVVGAAGDFEYWTLKIIEGSARVLDHAEGTRMISASGNEFDGEINVYAGYWGLNAGYRENATYRFEVQNQFLASYSPSYTNFQVKSRTGTEIERLSITSPDGSETRCDCWWRDYGGPNSHGPGTYTYRLDAPKILYDVYVMGADVNIPWIQAD